MRAPGCDPPPRPPWPADRPGPGRVRRRRRRPLRRQPDERMLGGVAAGVAAARGLDVTLVRVGFVVAALFSGIGVAVYVLAWLLVPAEGAPAPIAATAASDRRGISLAAALATLVVLALLAAAALGAGWLGKVGWATVIGVAGLVLLWRNAPPDEQATLRRLAEPVLQLSTPASRGRTALRLALAVALVAGGLVALLNGHPSTAALRPLAGVALVIAAIVVALGPWWLRVARDLVLERQARARAEERAEVAARVHDSVLQTLALIQRRADSAQEVLALARAQERELRSWLFDGRPPGSVGNDATTLAAGLRALQQEVEALHRIPVEVVTVGDCPLDERLRALLAATREACVNAAKWSGAPVVSVFAEVDEGAVSVYVRDRGRGFDPASVGADRRGLAQSVHGRMARHGGSSNVRSAPGEGTEVALRMARRSGDPQPSPA